MQFSILLKMAISCLMSWESRISALCILFATLFLCMYISSMYIPAETSRNVDTWPHLFWVTTGGARDSTWWAGICTGPGYTGLLHWSTSKLFFIPSCPFSYICYTDSLPTFFVSSYFSIFISWTSDNSLLQNPGHRWVYNPSHTMTLTLSPSVVPFESTLLVPVTV